jgi:hypothetical protein
MSEGEVGSEKRYEVRMGVDAMMGSEQGPCFKLSKANKRYK